MALIYQGEDSLLHQELVATILTLLPDVEVVSFNDGLELYLAVLRQPPQVIVLDIILPGANGLAICWLLKHHQKFEHIPLILVSSMMGPDVEKRARAAGADVFLHKPLDPMELQGHVARLLKTAGAARQPAP